MIICRKKVKEFSMHGRVPQKASPGSACYDVYSAKSVILHLGETKPIETDISMKFSKKYALPSFRVVVETCNF